MKIIYALEASDFLSEEEIKRFMEECKKPEVERTEVVGKLAKEFISKAQPALNDITKRFSEELGQFIGEIAGEVAAELVGNKIIKILKENDETNDAK